MLKWLSDIQWYVSPAMAAEMGATHYARIHGVIPGYFGERDGMPLWISRSDLLNPIEDALSFLARFAHSLSGDDEHTVFDVCVEI